MSVAYWLEIRKVCYDLDMVPCSNLKPARTLPTGSLARESLAAGINPGGPFPRPRDDIVVEKRTFIQLSMTPKTTYNFIPSQWPIINQDISRSLLREEGLLPNVTLSVSPVPHAMRACYRLVLALLVSWHAPV